MSVFEHHRFEIWNQAQHPYKHSLTDLAYANNALNGITTAQGALDYICAVLYPNNKAAVANVAALPSGGNVINDYRVVLDDGDGKAAGYRWEQREGEGAASWHKIYDVDFGAGTYLAQAYENYQDLFVQKFGNDDLDAAGAAVTGTLAGQTIFGGKSANTNLTLKANAGDGTGAATGYVQFGDNARPTSDGVFNLGTTALRFGVVFAQTLDAVGSNLTLKGASLTQLTFASSAGLPYITSTGKFEMGSFCGVGGASSNLAAMTAGVTNPLTQTRQWAFYSPLAATSSATGAAGNPTVAGFVSQITTANSAFTAPLRAGFYHFNTTKGAASTITRDVGVFIQAPTQGGTGNAALADVDTFTGSYTMFFSNTNASRLSGRLGFSGDSTSAVIYSNSSGVLSGTDQQGVDIAITSTSAATATVTGFRGQATTGNASFTCANLYQFYGSNTTKGAASTITRHAIYGGAAPTQGTNNAFITDTLNFSTGTYGAYLGAGANYFFGPMIHGTATVASTATITALASTTSVVKLSGSTATALQGITAPATGIQDGQRMIVFSVGANLTVANENAGATAANRITTCTGADVAGTAPCAFTFVYDSTSTRWILVSSNA